MGAGTLYYEGWLGAFLPIRQPTCTHSHTTNKHTYIHTYHPTSVTLFKDPRGLRDHHPTRRATLSCAGLLLVAHIENQLPGYIAPAAFVYPIALSLYPGRVSYMSVLFSSPFNSVCRVQQRVGYPFIITRARSTGVVPRDNALTKHGRVSIVLCQDCVCRRRPESFRASRY